MRRKELGGSKHASERPKVCDGYGGFSIFTHAHAHTHTHTQLPFTQLKKETSQLEGPSPNNTYGFKISQSALPCDSHEVKSHSSCLHSIPLMSRFHPTHVSVPFHPCLGSIPLMSPFHSTHVLVPSHQVQYLTSMSVELHMHSRGSLRPDPEFDPVLAIFYYIHNDWPAAGGGGNSHLGVIAMDNVDACSFVASPQKAKVHTYIRTYTHTHIHTYIHRYIQTSSPVIC